MFRMDAYCVDQILGVALGRKQYGHGLPALAGQHAAAAPDVDLPHRTAKGVDAHRCPAVQDATATVVCLDEWHHVVGATEAIGRHTA